ncbi:MAG: hypothetical protein JW779_07115 [Candidatus Thorarchaeota archaeon]|nr:hypothetical protein [Candidatus Thorarchaeota archaeon]
MIVMRIFITTLMYSLLFSHVMCQTINFTSYDTTPGENDIAYRFQSNPCLEYMMVVRGMVRCEAVSSEGIRDDTNRTASYEVIAEITIDFVQRSQEEAFVWLLVSVEILTIENNTSILPYRLEEIVDNDYLILINERASSVVEVHSVDRGTDMENVKLQIGRFNEFIFVDKEDMSSNFRESWFARLWDDLFIELTVRARTNRIWSTTQAHPDGYGRTHGGIISWGNAQYTPDPIANDSQNNIVASESCTTATMGQITSMRNERFAEFDHGRGIVTSGQATVEYESRGLYENYENGYNILVELVADVD